MKKFVQLSIVLLTFSCVTSDDLEEIHPILTGDPNWPRTCVAPNCDVVNRSLRYPTTTSRQFYQCNAIPGGWNLTVVNCRCESLFDYMQQGCVRFDAPRTEWCLNNVDSTWISCTDETTTLPPDTPAPQTPAPPPEETTTPRYSTVSWG